MENAAKALMIAGGIFLAILVLTVGVILYMNLNNNAKTYATKVQATKISRYNEKFEALLGREDLKPAEVLSILNYAEQNGKDVGAETRVVLQLETAPLGMDLGQEYVRDVDRLELFLKDQQNRGFTYICEEIEYTDDSIVSLIKFRGIRDDD